MTRSNLLTPLRTIPSSWNNSSAPNKLRTMVVFAAAIVAILCLPQTVLAQQVLTDKVVIRDERSGRNIAYRCHILDYTGKSILLRFRSNNSRSFPAKLIVEIDSPKTKPHLDGMAAYAGEEYRTARTFLERALTTESRTWMRREILASLVRCEYHLGNYPDVASRFLSIASSDPSTQHFYLIPLKWSNSLDLPALKREAKRWISDRQPSSKLIAASFLLFDATDHDRAVVALQQLSLSGDANVRDLATAQLWRVRLRDRKIFTSEVERWREIVESMPLKMRGGPFFLLGQVYEKIHRSEEAAISYLRMPLLYDFDRYQSAEALLKAADILASTRKAANAKLLYREIGVRFPGTPAAKIATRSLEKPGSPKRRTSVKDPSR